MPKQSTIKKKLKKQTLHMDDPEVKRELAERRVQREYEDEEFKKQVKEKAKKHVKNRGIVRGSIYNIVR